MSGRALEFAIDGIGVQGPGLPGWPALCAALLSREAWVRGPTVIVAPTRLPAAERRRAGAIIKLSMAVADEACAQADADPATLPTVFGSATGDGANCHALCEALATPERVISPTRFTNSVHNAPAGYWHIGTQSRAASSSLSAFEGTLGAALLDAGVQCAAQGRRVLMVVADVPHPEPLAQAFPVADAMAVALVLSPVATPASLGWVKLSLTQDAATPCALPALEELRREIPAARVLPLLEALGHRGAGVMVLDYLPDLRLAVQLGS